MGTKKPVRKATRPKPSGLADALFSKVQQRVLGVLLGNPGRSFYANEVIGLARSGTGAVQRELTSLESAGILTAKKVGRQKHYRANVESPIFEELHSLAVKTFGLADVLREALAPVAGEIRAAFVFGSIAKQRDTSGSDVDVMVISDTVTYSVLFAAIEKALARLGRKVEPTIYTPREFAARVEKQNSFVTRVLNQPKVWLIGDERDLAA